MKFEVSTDLDIFHTDIEKDDAEDWQRSKNEYIVKFSSSDGKKDWIGNSGYINLLSLSSKTQKNTYYLVVPMLHSSWVTAPVRRFWPVADSRTPEREKGPMGWDLKIERTSRRG